MRVLNSRRAKWALVCVLAAVALFTVYRLTLGQQVRRTYRDLIERGVLISVNELESMYPNVANEDNAAPLYDKAEALATEFEFTEAEWEKTDFWDPFNASSYTDEQIERVVAYLDTNKTALEVMSDAAKMEHVRFHLSSADDPSWTWTSERFSNLTALTVISFRFHLFRNDFERAEDVLNDALVLVTQLEKCPSLWALLTASRLRTSLMRAVVLSSSYDANQDDRLLEFAHRLATRDEVNVWPKVAGSMIAQIYEDIDDDRRHRVERADPGEYVEQLLYFQLPWVGRTYEWMRDVFGAMDRQRLNDMRDIDQIFPRLALEISDWYSMGRNRDYFEVQTDYTELCLYVIIYGWPSIPYSRARLFEAHTQLETDFAAVAAERFKTVNGRLPYELSELVPDYFDAVPPDPYDGKPLRSISNSGSFIVYSVGPDRVDNKAVLVRGSSQVDIASSVFLDPLPTENE